MKKSYECCFIGSLMARKLSKYEKAFLEKLELLPGAKMEITAIWRVKEKEHNLRRWILSKLCFYLVWLALIAALLLTEYCEVPNVNRIVLFVIWLLAIVMACDCHKSNHVFSWTSMSIYYSVEKRQFWNVINLNAVVMIILLIYINHMVTAVLLLIGVVMDVINDIHRHDLVKATLPEAEIGVAVSYLKDGTPVVSVQN